MRGGKLHPHLSGRRWACVGMTARDTVVSDRVKRRKTDASVASVVHRVADISACLSCLERAEISALSIATLCILRDRPPCTRPHESILFTLAHEPAPRTDHPATPPRSTFLPVHTDPLLSLLLLALSVAASPHPRHSTRRAAALLPPRVPIHRIIHIVPP